MAALYACSVYDYLLFHVLAELFSIIVAFGIFIVAWNTRRVIENYYLLFLGIAYLFVGGLDLIHTVSYEGMGLLQEYGPNLPTQLWISARYTESLSLLIATFFLKRKFKPVTLTVVFSVVTVLVLFSIFTGKFPDCFIEGSGLTPFKKISEYIISFIFITAIVPIYKKRHDFERAVFLAITASLLFSVGAELAFTFYVDVYGLSNLIGHLFKLISFFLIYKALIETGLARPYDLLFRDLARREADLRVSEKKYRSLFDNMLDGFAYHKIIQNENGNPSDYVFLEVNTAFERLTGLKSGEIVGKRVTEVLPGIQESAFDWIGEYGRVALTGQEMRTEQYSEQLGKWYAVSAFSPMKGYFVALFEDITGRKQGEELTKHLASFPQLNPNPVMETDSSGNITYINPAIKKILEGLGMDENDARVFLPDDFDDILRQLEKKMDSTFYRETIIRERVYGSTVHLSPQFNVVRIYANDITERKKVEDAIIRTKEEWERTFNSVPDLIAILDREHRIVRANRAMAERLGLSADTCVGLTCFTCVHGSSLPPAACPHTLSMKDSKEHSAELREDSLGGDFLVTTTPIFDEGGRMVGSVHVARDITERKKAEKERERLLEELVRSNKELEQFAYIASHDLQEPLRTISSYVQLISQRYKDRLDGEAEEFMNYLVSAAVHLQTLLNDLLAYSRVGAHRDPFQLTDLNSVLGRATDNLKTSIDRSNAAIQRERLPSLYVDKVQMAQVFQNLIGNAIKFRGDEPPRIQVSADLENNEWVFRVSDNGIGMESKYLSRIFHIFKRLHSRAKYDGTGIGLAICKKIVERHGGRIWVESEPGKGSTFYFTIPNRSYKI
jgi:PAS domain S-box-containing protein